MLSRIPKKSFQVFVLIFFCLTSLPAAAEDTWFYPLGILVKKQQINFCESLEDVQTIMAAFTQNSPKKGYEVLSQNQNCHLDVKSFTPKKIVQQFVIKTGESDYTISFVAITSTDNEQLFLFTTRPIKQMN